MWLTCSIEEKVANASIESHANQALKDPCHRNHLSPRLADLLSRYKVQKRLNNSGGFIIAHTIRTWAGTSQADRGLSFACRAFKCGTGDLLVANDSRYRLTQLSIITEEPTQDHGRFSRTVAKN